MTQFMGTHQNRLDAKGRVSIPAPFRAALRGPSAEATTSVVLRPSHNHRCIEGWPVAAFAALAAPLEAMEMFSPEADDLAATIYGNACPMELDREGRIVLPEMLVEHAGLTGVVEFMGLGRTFQIWEPEAAKRRRAEARERAHVRGLTVPGVPYAGGGQGSGISGLSPQQPLGTPTT